MNSRQETSSWHLGGWALWSIAALYYAYEFLHRVAPSVLTTQLREAFSVNEQQLGTIGAMYFYAYAAFQLPAGVLVDRYGAKRLLVLASTILTLGSFLFASTTSITVAQLSRFMIGAGSAFAFVGCLKIGAQWLAMSSFPLVVGLTNLFGTLGALSGGMPLSYLAEKVGWRPALLQVSFAGLLITLLLWLFLQDRPNPKSSPETTTHDLIEIKPHLWAGLALVIKNPKTWIIALYGALLVAPIAAIPEMWGVEFLKVAYQIPGTHAAAITHTIFVGTAVGGPLIGWLMTHNQDKIHFMMLATLSALVLLSLFLYWTLIPQSILYGILFCYGICTANMLLCFTLITECHPPWAQGAAIGFINMVIMASAGLIQHGIGWMLDKLRSLHEGVYRVEDYHIALSILPVCLLIAIVLTLFIRKTDNA